jgi:hypothetical protein
VSPRRTWLFACLALTACGAPAPQDPAQAEQARIAGLHRAKCGACHKRVEPGTRLRPVLEAAFVRHRKRLVLEEDDWAKLTEYLARP